MAHPLISTHHLEDTKSLGFLATIQSRSTNLCPTLLDTVTSVTSVTLIHVVGSVARAWIRASPLHLTRGPQGAYRSTGQSKIVSFSDPIISYTFFYPFLVSPTCVQLWVPVLWQVFFPLQRRFFPALPSEMVASQHSIAILNYLKLSEGTIHFSDFCGECRLPL